MKKMVFILDTLYVSFVFKKEIINKYMKSSNRYIRNFSYFKNLSLKKKITQSFHQFFYGKHGKSDRDKDIPQGFLKE